MAKSNHATKGANGTYCTHCSSATGAAVHDQSTNCDGEIYCARCFVWWRMHQPGEQGTHGTPRFKAHQTCVAKCQFCHWTIVCFGATPGRQLLCTNCMREGCIRVALDHEYLKPQNVREAIEQAQLKVRAAL